jgi:hypothetical protein
VAFCTLAVMVSSVAIAADPIQMARFSEESIPAEDMPSVIATPMATPSGGSSSGDWVEVPASSPSGAAAVAPSAQSSPLPPELNAAQLEPTPLATPTDVAPLEVGSVAPQGQVSDASLDTLIQSIGATQPALAASLRMTDQAREEILKHQDDDAIQNLTRAISIEATNPYAYFYLGRAFLGKKNYAQAITFFDRAQTHFGTNPQWLGETLAFEGLTNEQSGQMSIAIAYYQKALVAVPGNLMARVGLTRLSGEQTAPAIEPAPAPEGPPEAPSEGNAIQPPPDERPPAPAQSAGPVSTPSAG